MQERKYNPKDIESKWQQFWAEIGRASCRERVSWTV